MSETTPPADRRRLLQDAMRAIEEMRRKVDDPGARAQRADRDRRHRLPLPRRRGRPEAFWRLLRDGVDAISEVPADRWDVDDDLRRRTRTRRARCTTRCGGFLDASTGSTRTSSASRRAKP